jgi:hypothetical protein
MKEMIWVVGVVSEVVAGLAFQVVLNPKAYYISGTLYLPVV